MKIYSFHTNLQINMLKVWCIVLFRRIVESHILRKLRTSGGRTEKAASGMRNGGNTMMPLAKQRNGPINFAALTPTHSLSLATLMFGMKGKELYHFHTGLRLDCWFIELFEYGSRECPKLAIFL